MSFFGSRRTHRELSAGRQARGLVILMAATVTDMLFIWAGLAI